MTAVCRPTCLFWYLYLAHLLADYPLQTDGLMRVKDRWWGRGLHVGVHLAVVPVGVGQKVEFADVGAGIAIVGQKARQGDRLRRDRDAVAGDAQRGRVLPAQHAHPAGHTDRILHEKVVKVQPLPGQSIQVGRLDLGVAVDA